MIDELTLYNLEVKYHNLKDIANAIEEMVRAEVIEEVLEDINLGIDATGHSTQYTTGMSNGLIWLKSCITHEEPQFFEPQSQIQTRAEVVEEVTNEVLNLSTKYIDNFDYVSVALIINKLEQLKENK